MSSRKRKHVSRKQAKDSVHIHDEDEFTIDPALFTQAYEADIIRGPRGHVAALSLEVRNVEGEIDVGSGLIRLGGDGYAPTVFPDDDVEDEDKGEGPSRSKDDNAIWVDRYDARLLLDSDSLSQWTTKAPDPKATAAPSSPTGWSDLPSDSEDTFFFSPEETEDYRREKRRRLMEQSREERLKARMKEDGEEIWGGSDEEPEEAQREIMQRTAKSIFASPNPAQLEMRILANHGADARFAFLRGRWSRAWRTIKARSRVEKEEEEAKALATSSTSAGQSLGMGLVAEYGDSDASEAEEDAKEDVDDAAVSNVKEAEESVSNQGEPESVTATEAAKEARRARAREWMQSRKLSGQ